MITECHLCVQVSKSKKPSILVKCETIEINVPIDDSRNYETLMENLDTLYTIKLQKMQQQHKITLQRLNVKKPEVVIYVSKVLHEPSLKVTIREMNSSFEMLKVTSEVLNVNGTIRGRNITLESTKGTMHIYGTVSTLESLKLISGKIIVASETAVCVQNMGVRCRNLQIDGRIFPLCADDRKMIVHLDCNLVHVGVGGSIGLIPDKVRSSEKERFAIRYLELWISGNFANYGKVSASKKLVLKICGSLISLSSGSLDSAGRGFDALKKLRNLDGNGSISAPSNSKMHQEICDKNPESVAFLIENGIDLNDTISKNNSSSKGLTHRQAAITEYRATKCRTLKNSAREKIALINALFVASDWRRGSIHSRTIESEINGDCDDVAQFSARTLRMKVAGSMTVETGSIFTSTWIEIDVKKDAFFHGQTKVNSMVLHTVDSVNILEDAILSCEQFGRVDCADFTCSGLWCSGEKITLSTSYSKFKAGSYIETEELEIKTMDSCEIDGTWQLNTCSLNSFSNVAIHTQSKLFFKNRWIVSAARFHCSGYCHASNRIELILSVLTEFCVSSRVESGFFNLTCRGDCILEGYIDVNNLNIYNRNILTTSVGKTIVSEKAEVTTGMLKNTTFWQVQKNFKIIAGSVVQTNQGSICAKCFLSIRIHDKSSGLFGGRLISSHIFLEVIRDCTFSGLIRCNEMEVALPYVSQSLLILKGQIDIVPGCLTIHGNLSLLENAEHTTFSGIILDGVIKAQAIIAPFVRVLIAKDTSIHLSGARSKDFLDNVILINAGALTTEKNSTITSVDFSTTYLVGKKHKTEAIVCSTIFCHAGQFKRNSTEIKIVSPVFINTGTFLDNDISWLNNNIIIQFDYMFQNNAVLSCASLQVYGKGILDNQSLIHTESFLKIEAASVSNENGTIYSKKALEIVSFSSEWTKIRGLIQSTNYVFGGKRLKLVINNSDAIANDNVVKISSEEELKISSNIINKDVSLECSSHRNMIISAELDLESAGLFFGMSTELDNELIISEEASIRVRNILITNTFATSNTTLKVIVNGRLTCEKLRFSGDIKKVIFVGSGVVQVDCMMLPKTSMFFDMTSTVYCERINCESFNVPRNTVLRLSELKEDVFIIVSENVNILGKLLSNKPVAIKSMTGTTFLDKVNDVEENNTNEKKRRNSLYDAANAEETSISVNDLSKESSNLLTSQTLTSDSEQVLFTLAMQEMDEIAVFEMLEIESELETGGIISTDVILSRGQNIYLAKLKNRKTNMECSKPPVIISMQTDSDEKDLILKKHSVRTAVSNLELCSFGSQSTLFSDGFPPFFGSQTLLHLSSINSRSPYSSLRNSVESIAQNSNSLHSEQHSSCFGY